MYRPALVALLSFGLAACEEASLPTAPQPAVGDPAYAISDGARGGGNGHFFFLPPMLPSATYAGVFDPGATPVVEICALATSAACVAGPPVASYSKTAGTGGELVTVDPVAEQYAVKWRTKNFDLSPTVIYRISVRMGASVLGYADVQVVLTNQQAKNVDTGQFIPLVDDRMLLIAFRIERGAVGLPLITIDARALSPPVLALSTQEPFPSASVQQLSLAPGNYSLSYNAGASQPNVSFTVTPSGLVDYSTQLDGILTGRGSTSLTVTGRSIRVDASALTVPTFDVNYVLTNEPIATVPVLTLLPGDHAVLYNAGVSQPSVTFTVTTAGTVDYASGLDGVLAGRGTATLKVAGRSISVDASALSVPTFDVNYVLAGEATTVVPTLTLLPGDHAVLYNAGASQPSVTFTVTTGGAVEYASELDGVLAGRGTAALKVVGRNISVDASALSVPTFDVNYVLAGEPTTVVRTLTLLPGDHAVLYNAGASQPSVTFTVTLGGTIDYASGLDGILGGRGTAVLQVEGRTVQVDATALDVAMFSLAFIGDFAASSPQALTLLPGSHHITAASRSFDFGITQEGLIDYSSTLYPFLLGIGTSVLTVQ